MSSESKLISIKEAARMLGVTPLTLRNWDNAGKLTARRHPLNNYRVYLRQDIENLIKLIGENVPPPRPRRTKGPRKLQVKHEKEG